MRWDSGWTTKTHLVCEQGRKVLPSPRSSRWPERGLHSIQYDSRPKDSGKRTGRLHTPQRYSRRLRRVMYMSALTAARCDAVSRAYYQRKRAEGKRPVQAAICLARRRVDVLYALIRDNRTWQPNAPVTAVAA
jgi:hypothetical protein